MTHNLLSEHSCWSASLAVLVEQVCNKFEQARKAGRRPHIDDYLADTPEPERSTLLRELLALELEYCTNQGDAAVREEYERRFPEHVELIREVYREALPQGSRSTHPTPAEQANLDTDEPSAPASGTDPGSAHAGARGRLDLDWDGTRAYARGAAAELSTQREREPEQTSLRPLPTVRDYEILRVLGRGGMGIVYQARHRELNRLVALKMLLATADTHELARFRSEANAVARLQHPHIVQIYEVGEQDGLPYFSLEFVDGGSLRDKLAGTPLPAQQAARLVELLARAVHVAHQRNLVHRDLKPGNVLLARSDAIHGVELGGPDELGYYLPKIADFGLAKRLDEDSGHTRSGAIMGTPSYMAPEQAAAKHREVGPAADGYALGAMLYELLTGRPPFRAATLLETLEQVSSQEPLPPTRLQPKLSRDLETICLKCLEKEPRKRYASAEALADDLRRFLVGEPIQARRTPLWERGLKWVKRRPAIAASLAASLVAVLGMFASLLSYAGQQKLEAEKNRLIVEQQLADREARSKVQELILNTQKAVADKRWEEARPLLSSALALIDSYPSLEDLRPSIGQLQAESERGSAQQLALGKASANYRQFFEWHQKALLHGAQFTGVDLPPNVRATREAIAEALKLLGVSYDGAQGPVFHTSLTQQQKDDLTTGCYELLLILADTWAQQQPNPRFERARDILDGAAQLRPHTKAYHLRRARYLARLGDPAGAKKEGIEAAKCPPAGAFDHFVVGDDLRRQGQLYAAIDQFESALRLQPDHFWARYFLAVCYLGLPRPDARSARDCLTACLEKQPDLVQLYVFRGVAHVELLQFRAAEEDFQKALDRNPDDEARYSILVNRGVLQKRQKKFDKAAADLKEAIQVLPNRYQAYMNLAEAYEEQALRDQIVGIQTGAILPGQCQGVLNVLSAYQHQKNLREAVEQLDKAIAVSQPLVQAKELGPPALARLFRYRSELHRKRQELKAALADIQRAIQTEGPASKSSALADYHAEHGRLLYVAQEYAKAVVAYDSALKTRPTNADAHRWRAEALVELRDFREATRSFDQYVKHGGKPSATFYQARGQVWALMHQYPEAISDYTQALALAPDSITYAARGWIYVVTDDKPLALHDFQEAIRLDPKNGDARNGRGFIRAKLGLYATARGDAEEAVRLGPKTARHLWNAARIYAEVVGRMDADPRPRSSWVLTARADCQDQALLLLRQALELTPGPDRASFWQSKVEADPVFRAIRTSTAYVQLRAQNAKPPSKSEPNPKLKAPITRT